MSSIFTEQQATEPFTLLFIRNPLHFLPILLDPLPNYKTYLGKCPFLRENIGNIRFLALGVVEILDATLSKT
jgi:hypothetical protein